MAATNTLNDTAVEYIGGIEVIKVFGKAKSSYEKFVTAAKECAQSYIDWMNKSNFYFTFAMNIMPATLLTVLPIGGLLLKNGTLMPTTFVLIVILSMGLITPIIGCMKFTDDLAKAGTILSQVTDILTAPELSRPETDAQTPQGNTVELHNVHFGYGETEVLHGIDLTFRDGTVNALVGSSGSGKSTIAKLIASFWDVSSGNITVGGADIRSVSSEHYNKLVAYVSQDNFLFDNTVRENIRMGRPGATDVEVEQAAKDCGCYEFIRSLENGFDTQVGSGGGHLSGGEKQRISIARAMMKDAPIIILNEATANVDPENEKELMEAVSELTQEKTVIMIAHRLKTVRRADQILVVDREGDRAAGHPRPAFGAGGHLPPLCPRPGAGCGAEAVKKDTKAQRAGSRPAGLFLLMISGRYKGWMKHQAAKNRVFHGFYTTLVAEFTSHWQNRLVGRKAGRYGDPIGTGHKEL